MMFMYLGSIVINLPATHPADPLLEAFLNADAAFRIESIYPLWGESGV